MAKIVQDRHYHLWTDVLHGRELCRQANNRWDRGTYGRWTIITGFIVLEIACNDALGVTDVGYRFREHIDRAIEAKDLPTIDWGRGLWQRVAELHGLRVDFVHRNLDQQQLFVEVGTAEEAVSTIRDAASDIYRRAGREGPAWLHDDEDKGWDKGASMRANLTVTRAGVDKSAEDTIRIAYVYKDKECDSEYLRPEADPEAALDDLEQRLQLPVGTIRAYRGSKLISERQTWIRGS